MNAQDLKKIDIQGHRGCRGLYPENSIPAFIHALQLGVNTLELDVVISKDEKVIISHEPFMSHLICRLPDSTDITKNNEITHKIFELNYNQIKDYDCGSKYVEKFPLQIKLPTYKPSLSDMVKSMEVISRHHFYNIEIKRKPYHDGLFHPPYKRFADLVIKELNALEITNRTTVQCFDVETLQYIHLAYPDIKLVYLIENNNSFQENIDFLGFTPNVYSPYFKLVDKGLTTKCKAMKILLIPWTVNTLKDMKSIIEIGVDGIISDYPDLLIKTMNQLTIK